MSFDPETDEALFAETRATLLEAFEAWCEAHPGVGAPAPEAAGDVWLALDWKLYYGGGDLSWWRVEHLVEFLLEWCPRKLSVPAGQAASIPASLARFVAYLHAEGLLAPGSSSPDEAARAAEELTGGFLAAMSDPSKFGMAKSLFAEAAADGVDLEDPEDVERWVNELNRRPREERPALPASPARPARPKLPPVAMPSEEAVAASRAQAPILAMFARLAEFVGSGRRLTQKGNLTLADARDLVPLLGTDDVVDFAIGDHVHRLPSAEDLPMLRYVLAWARKAGVVRVQHGKLMATKVGLALGSDPVRLFDRAVDALLAAGPLSIQRYPDRWGSWPDVDEVLDHVCVALLVGPYSLGRPVPIESLVEGAAETVLGTFRFPYLSDEEVTSNIAGDVTDMMDILAVAGITRRDGVEPPDRPWRRRGSGGTVALTPAGVRTVRRLLGQAGYEVPEAGRWAEASAAELLSGTDGDDFATMWGELQAWRARRSDEDAVAQLGDAVLALADPALRNLALAAMGDIDTRLAAPHVRRLSAERASRGAALCWLVDHGMESPAALYDPVDPEVFVDVLAQRLVGHGPEAMMATLELAGAHDAQTALIGRLWRCPSQATLGVLTVIGSAHPSKAVAKAARKAVFQRRSSSLG